MSTYALSPRKQTTRSAFSGTGLSRPAAAPVLAGSYIGHTPGRWTRATGRTRDADSALGVTADGSPRPWPLEDPGIGARSRDKLLGVGSVSTRGLISGKIVGGVNRHVRASFGTTLAGSRALPPLQDRGITRGRARSGERV